MDGQATQWRNITDEFKASAKELQLGELAKSEQFSLHEAMSAIVIMNPKMDSGMFHANREVLNLEQSIKCGKLKVNSFTHQEMIGIIDETYACLVAWLGGPWSLAQTVMTNLYLHEPNRIEDKCMRIFCCAILKCSEMLRDIAVSKTFYEEEEFQPGLMDKYYNNYFNYTGQVSDAKVLVSLKEVCDDLDKRIASKPVATDLDDVPKDQTLESTNDITAEMKNMNLDSKTVPKRPLLEALANRMKYTRFFYHALMIITKEFVANETRTNVAMQSALSSTKSNNHSNKSNFGIANTCDNINRNLTRALELVEPWIETIRFGIEKPSAKSLSGTESCDQFTVNPDYPTIMGFEPLINQHYIPAYPRCPHIPSRESAAMTLRNLCICLAHSCQAAKLTNFDAVLDFFRHFSKQFKPSSCIISRSFLQLIYTNIDALVWTDLMRNSMRDFIDPVVLQCKSTICAANPQLRDSVERFVVESTMTFMQTIRVYGHNRALQREKLAENIESLKTLQFQAVHIDYQIDEEKTCVGSFVTWTTYHIVRLCIEYLLSGFELELYAAHEYPYIYWYLYKWLYDRQTFFLNAAKCSIEEQESLAATRMKNGKKSNKPAKIKPQRPHQKEIALSEALRCLSGGLYFVLSGLKIQSKIIDPKPEFSSEKIRFVHRFHHLTGTGIAPEIHDNYEKYRELSQHLKGQSLVDIYTVAHNLFNQAKSLIQLGQESDVQMNQCLKVVKTNLIVAKVLASASDVPIKEPVFDFSAHASFPILKVL